MSVITSIQYWQNIWIRVVVKYRQISLNSCRYLYLGTSLASILASLWVFSSSPIWIDERYIKKNPTTSWFLADPRSFVKYLSIYPIFCRLILYSIWNQLFVHKIVSVWNFILQIAFKLRYEISNSFWMIQKLRGSARPF